jgi:hypothetical protein
MNSQVWRALIITSVLVGASACSGKRNGEVIAGAAGTPEAPQQQTESVASDNDASAPRLKLKDLNALVDLVVAEAKDLPRAEFDPAALAAKLGNNPQAHFEWVRDHTWWAPYRGLFRGSQGVMPDRVGSSLDRAVLATLPGINGHDARLTQGVVDTTAESLVVAGCQRCGPVANVSTVWNFSQKSGIAWDRFAARRNWRPGNSHCRRMCGSVSSRISRPATW